MPPELSGGIVFVGPTPVGRPCRESRRELGRFLTRATQRPGASWGRFPTRATASLDQLSQSLRPSAPTIESACRPTAGTIPACVF